MCGWIKHAFNHKLCNFISCHDITKNYSRKYKLWKLQGCFTFYRASALNTFQKYRAWALKLSTKFSLFLLLSMHTYMLFSLFFLLYNLILLHINRLKLILCKATDLIIKYCSNYLSRNLSLEIYFECFIYERHEIFILSQRLTKTNLIQTLIDSAKMKCWSSSNWYFQHQSQISKYLE